MFIFQFLEEKINQVIMTNYIPNIIFILIFSFAIIFFLRNILKLRKVILMGKSVNRSDRKLDRLKNMIRIALGLQNIVILSHLPSCFISRVPRSVSARKTIELRCHLGPPPPSSHFHLE